VVHYNYIYSYKSDVISSGDSCTVRTWYTNKGKCYERQNIVPTCNLQPKINAELAAISSDWTHWTERFSYKLSYKLTTFCCS